jgi:hypothetical protein
VEGVVVKEKKKEKEDKSSNTLPGDVANSKFTT